ncbi:MAG: hypothetical protein RL301_404 [Actinomycetota bacterium]
MGCGRVGSGLAKELEAAGHSVAVIDNQREAFRRLGPDFKGKTVNGVGFDRDILIQADIQNASAFAAVSNGDNSNILAARVARETFGVDNVVARIYDPARAEIYQRLGIPTVATVQWAQDQILRKILPVDAQSEWQDASGRVKLAEFPYHIAWVGQPISEIELRTKTKAALITRLAEGFIPDGHTVLQEGDILHLTVEAGEMANVSLLLAKDPEGN